MEQQSPASTAHLRDLDPLERVRRFLDERERPTPFAPEGCLPTGWLARITRTGDTLLVSDVRDLLDRAERYDRLVEGLRNLRTQANDEALTHWSRHNEAVEDRDMAAADHAKALAEAFDQVSASFAALLASVRKDER